MPVTETCELCPGVKCTNKTWKKFLYPPYQGRVTIVTTGPEKVREFQFQSEPIKNCPGVTGKESPEALSKRLKTAASSYSIGFLTGEGGPGY